MTTNVLRRDSAQLLAGDHGQLLARWQKLRQALRRCRVERFPSRAADAALERELDEHFALEERGGSLSTRSSPTAPTRPPRPATSSGSIASCGPAGEGEVVHRAVGHQRQRHDLQGANTEPQARATVGVPEKYRWWHVPMMPPDRKIVAESRAALRREARPQEPAAEEERDDGRGGKDLEEALDPQMNDPPPPVFDDRQVRVRPQGQPGPLEQRDRAGRDQEQPQQDAAARPAARRAGQQHADHQEQPEQQARRTARSATRGPDRRTRSLGGRSRTRPCRTACCERSAIRRSASRRRRPAAPGTAR